MTTNVRFLLGGLALAALVSAWFLFGLSPHAPAVSPDGQQALISQASLADIDGDGLSLRDEQYWQTDPENPDTDGDGFKDGEEILSGHDPRVPGPKDYLDRRQNLTDLTTTLLIGGVVSGDLKPDNPDYDSAVDVIIRALTDEQSALTGASLVDVKLSSDSDDAKLAYISAMLKTYPDLLADVIREIDGLLQSIKDVRVADPESLIADTARYTAFQQEALRISDFVGTRADAGLAIRVPPSFRRQHANIILTLRLLQSDLRRSAQMHEDPILGMVSLQRVIRLSVEAIPVVIHDFAIAMNQKL